MCKAGLLIADLENWLSSSFEPRVAVKYCIAIWKVRMERDDL